MAQDLITTPSGTLTPMQDAFIDAFLSNGGIGSRAAEEAGYATTCAAQTAHKLLRNDTVLAEIARRNSAAQVTRAVKAEAVIDTLMTSARSEFVRLEAAKSVLTRAPTVLPSAGGITVNIDLSGGRERRAVVVSPTETPGVPVSQPPSEAPAG